MKNTKAFFVLAVIFAAFLTQSCKTAKASFGNAAPPAERKQITQNKRKSEQIESPETAEYNRSVSAIGSQKITFDDFQRDKTAIIAVISDLDKSMKRQDYNLWRSYLSPSSISYWSNKFNLQVIATKLPKKGIRLRSLADYFRYVFVPSRIDRKVNEIRYISPTEVKAVEVQNDKDIIYYEFEKIDGLWMVKLPTL